MNLSRLLKKIEKTSWWSEDCPGSYQFIVAPLISFIEQAKHFHPDYLSILFLIFKNDFFYEETSRKEKMEVYKYIFSKIKKDKKYLEKMRKFCHKEVCFLDWGKKIDELNHKSDNKQIFYLYHNFFKHYVEWLSRGSAMIECVDIFTEEKLPELVRKEIGSELDDNFNSVLTDLVTFPALSFMERERILFLQTAIAAYIFIKKNEKITLARLKKESLEFSKNIKNLAEKYFWIRNTYLNTKIISEENLLKEIKEEVKEKSLKDIKSELVQLKNKVQKLKNRKLDLHKKFNFSSELKKHFSIIEQLGEWIDYRKEHMLQANHYVNLFCQLISKKFKEDTWKIEYYLPDEIEELLLEKKRVPMSILKKRREFSIVVFERKNPKKWECELNVLYDEDAKKVSEAVFSKIDSDEIKGQVANRPKDSIQGEVQVVLDTFKQNFEKGKILVTSMTRPDFVPLMRKAKAIITDEGGLTCHAAIVSRELGIPCIIGTKIATEKLKNGDLVEMNLKDGTVKKL